jgi:hypothetical protein
MSSSLMVWLMMDCKSSAPVSGAADGYAGGHISGSPDEDVGKVHGLLSRDVAREPIEVPVAVNLVPRW